MHSRSLLFAGLLLAAGPAPLAWAQTAQTAEAAASATAAAAGLPARPTPFKFVNDQASLLTAANVKQLENGLRKYADQTGTQVVVVTVPTLGGRTAADYGRALGTAWGVGQRDKNNGVVVLISAKDRKVAIEAGSGLADRVTPAVKQRIIGQQFGPNFKQGNYFVGLKKGLSELMLAANPSTDPRQNSAAGATGGAAGATATAPALNSDGSGPAATAGPEPVSSGGGGIVTPPPPAEPSGPGMGTLLLGALGIGGLIFLLTRLFKRNSAASATNSAQGGAPNFNPNQPNFNQNQPNRPGGSPNFLPNQGQGGNYGPNNGPGYNNGPGFGGGGGLMGGGGPGIGGMLATGAAAAAGAYLGNRMAGGGHDSVAGNDFGQQQQAGLGGLGAGAAGVGGAGLGAGATAGDDYFSSRDGGSGGGGSEPDYFADDTSSANDGGSDYFSDDSGSSSYDDMSSGDSGGGGFDGGGGGDDSGSF